MEDSTLGALLITLAVGAACAVGLRACGKVDARTAPWTLLPAGATASCFDADPPYPYPRNGPRRLSIAAPGLAHTKVPLDLALSWADDRSPEAAGRMDQPSLRTEGQLAVFVDNDGARPASFDANRLVWRGTQVQPFTFDRPGRHEVRVMYRFCSYRAPDDGALGVYREREISSYEISNTVEIDVVD